MDFGSAPSGAIPIFYNDQHVYTRPDVLKQGRVLAALVRGGTIFIPLRSMFEAMGATVSYDPASKTVDVNKAGADIKVTLGVSQVIINGEARPLDVAPMLYHGTMLVPVRVISEGMGAYVQWVPDRRLVVVRYLPPTPPPTPAPSTPVPSPAPVATPAPALAPTRANEGFISGDYLISPKIYNELSPGNTGSGSYAAQAGLEFGTSLKFLLEGDYRSYRYPHNALFVPVSCSPGTAGCTTLNSNGQFTTGTCPAADPGCVTVVGYQNLQTYTGSGQAYVPVFTPQESDFDAHFGVKVLDPRIYIGVGYYSKSSNYLNRPIIAGVGGGVTKLPDLDRPFSLFGSVWYYPSVTGTYTHPTSVYLGPFSGQSVQLGYSVLKYRAGATLVLGPFFLEAGYGGEYLNAKTNAPSSATLNAPFAGLGFRF